MFEILVQERFSINCTFHGFSVSGPSHGHFHFSFNFWLGPDFVNIFQVDPQPFHLLRCENTEVALAATPVLALWCFGVGSEQQMLPVYVVLYCVSSRRLVVTQMAVIKQSAVVLQQCQNTSFL